MFNVLHVIYFSSGFTLEHVTGSYYHSSFSPLTSDEIQLVADIVSVIEAYQDGETDELPASGAWPEVAWEHFERLRKSPVRAKLPTMRLVSF